MGLTAGFTFTSQKANRVSQKLLHALTPRAFGVHRERKVLAVGCAHSQHLPLERLASEPFCLKKPLLRSPEKANRASQKSMRVLTARAKGARGGEEGAGCGLRPQPAPSSRTARKRAVLSEKTTFEKP